jgi:phage terminase small subunit
MDEQRAVELMEELGVSCEIGTETFEAMLEHPTVKAFVNGDVSISEAVFVEEYLANGFNATDAAKAAKYSAFSRGGYSTIGSSVLKKPKIKALVARRIAERALSANEVVDRIREVADGSIADVLSDDTTFIDLSKAKQRGKLHLLKEVKIGEDGDVHVKLRDQDQALDKLARSLGVYEKDNKVSLPAEVLALLGLSSGELQARDDAYADMQKEMEDEDAGATS